MTHAVVLGATGQIGRAAVDALTRDGWEVTAVSRGGDRDARWPKDVRVVRADREDDAALSAAVGEGCDVLVDMVAYGEREARQLVSLAGRVGSAVVISSVSVYEDDSGRNFDTQAEPDGFPAYPVPITEAQRTVRPGDGSYSTGKAALERELLAAGDRLPVTLLRAGDRGHVGAQELRVDHLVGDVAVPHGLRQHRAGELGDRVEAQEHLAVSGRPERVGPEEGEEPFGVLVPLGAFDGRHDAFDGLDAVDAVDALGALGALGAGFHG